MFDQKLYNKISSQENPRIEFFWSPRHGASPRREGSYFGSCTILFHVFIKIKREIPWSTSMRDLGHERVSVNIEQLFPPLRRARQEYEDFNGFYWIEFQ